jgi:hypothetical protein
MTRTKITFSTLKLPTKNIMNKSFIKIAGVSLLALSLSSMALAIPITGDIEIGFGSTVLVNSSNVVTTSLAAGAGNQGGVGIVNPISTGDFAAWAGSLVSYSSFNWSPSSAPVVPLWSGVGPFAGSFDLTSLTIDLHTSTQLNLSGYGVLHLAGFDDTAGLWTYQITDSDGFAAKFGFQSSNSASGVPDGGTTALLVGLGLVGMGVAAFRRKKA